MLTIIQMFQEGVAVKMGEGKPYFEITMEGSESQGRKYGL